jgi:hypothetical protein
MSKEKADFQSKYRSSNNHDYTDGSSLEPKGNGELKRKDEISDDEKQKIHDALDRFIERTEQIDK